MASHYFWCAHVHWTLNLACTNIQHTADKEKFVILCAYVEVNVDFISRYYFWVDAFLFLSFSSKYNTIVKHRRFFFLSFDLVQLLSVKRDFFSLPSFLFASFHSDIKRMNFDFHVHVNEFEWNVNRTDIIINNNAFCIDYYNPRIDYKLDAWNNRISWIFYQ